MVTGKCLPGQAPLVLEQHLQKPPKAESRQRPQVQSWPGGVLVQGHLQPVCVSLTPCFSAHAHNSQGPCSAPALSGMLAYSCLTGFQETFYPWAPISGGWLLGWPRRVPALGLQEMGFCFPVGRMETP